MDDKTADFMISEFNALQERANCYENIKSNRINLYLILFAATCAFLATNTNNLLAQYFFEIVILIAAFLFLIGIAVLWNVITYSGAIVVFYRRAARIRKSFLDREPSILSYIPFAPNDDKPTFFTGYSYIQWRGAEPILLLTNGICLSTLICFVIYKVFLIQPQYLFLIGFPLFSLSYYFQLLWIRHTLRSWDKNDFRKQKINYPSSTPNIETNE